MTDAVAAPPRRKWLTKLKENPAKVFTGTLAGVTFSRFRERLDFDEEVDPKTGQIIQKHTGRRWLEEPVDEYDDTTIEECKRRMKYAVLRPGAGIIKLDANWPPYDPAKREQGDQYTAHPAEGDLPLEDYVDLRPWDGPTQDEAETLRLENERLQKELAEMKAKLEQEEAEETANEAAKASPAPRTVGPRNKKKD